MRMSVARTSLSSRCSSDLHSARASVLQLLEFDESWYSRIPPRFTTLSRHSAWRGTCLVRNAGRAHMVERRTRAMVCKAMAFL